MQAASPAPDASPSPATRFHPAFTLDEADVVLASSDNVLFRVPSTTLKMTSSWFRTMFQLPQPAPSTPSTPRSPDTIALSEDSTTLEALLRMICGLEILPLTSWDTIEPLLYAAEKYDMPGPHSIVRALLRTPTFLDEPLRLYASACRYAWPSEASLASTLSLSLNLHDPAHRPALLKLKTPALLALQDLHHQRSTQFRARLAQAPFLTDAQLADPSARCSRCGEPLEYSAWRELKHAMEREIAARPLGDELRDGLEEWAQAKVCWAARCRKAACGAAVYDRVSTTRAILDAIKELPTVVDVQAAFGRVDVE